MKQYRIFVQSPGGCFGDLRVLPFEGDEAALRFAQDEILSEHPGCAVWSEKGRVALLLQRGYLRADGVGVLPPS